MENDAVVDASVNFGAKTATVTVKEGTAPADVAKIVTGQFSATVQGG